MHQRSWSPPWHRSSDSRQQPDGPGCCWEVPEALIPLEAGTDVSSVPQPRTSGQPLSQANILWSLHLSSRQPCRMSPYCPRLRWQCGGPATLTGAEMTRNDKWNLQCSHLGNASQLPSHSQGPCSPFLACLSCSLKPTSSAPFGALHLQSPSVPFNERAINFFSPDYWLFQTIVDCFVLLITHFDMLYLSLLFRKQMLLFSSIITDGYC